MASESNSQLSISTQADSIPVLWACTWKFIKHPDNQSDIHWKLLITCFVITWNLIWDQEVDPKVNFTVEKDFTVTWSCYKGYKVF